MQEASLYGTQMIKVAPGNAAGQVTADEMATWWSALERAAEVETFFVAVLGFIAAATSPSGRSSVTTRIRVHMYVQKIGKAAGQDSCRLTDLLTGQVGTGVTTRDTGDTQPGFASSPSRAGTPETWETCIVWLITRRSEV